METAEQIKLLIELQKLDEQIYKFRKRKNDIPVRIKFLEDEFKKKGDGLRAVQDAFKTQQVKQKDRENDLASKEETIKKSQAQLYQLKTNKEYQAMQHEIDGHNADKSVIEDEILVIFDENEAKKKDIDKQKSILAEEEKKSAQEKERVNSELKEIEEKLAVLDGQRKELAGKIDKIMLNKYERILKGKNGLAMVPVMHDACGGCNMNVPPQVINEIQMHNSLIFCESCARILYIE